MNIRRLVVGTIAGGLAMFVVGYIFWDMLFAGFFEANAGSATGVMREQQLLWATGLGTLCYALLIALGLESRAGTPTTTDGLKVGAVVGLLLWGSVDLIYYGYANLWNLTAHIADIALEGIRGAIGGFIIVAARKASG